jgi:hypothetical protein
MGGFTPAHYAVKFGYDKIVDWRDPPNLLPSTIINRHAPHNFSSQFWQPGAMQEQREKRDLARHLLARSVFA